MATPQPLVENRPPDAGAPAEAPKGTPRSPARKVRQFLSDNAIYSVLLVLVLVIASTEPAFLSVTCLRDILVHSSTRVIVALGASFAILTAGADLSVGPHGRLRGGALRLDAAGPRLPPALLPDLPCTCRCSSPSSSPSSPARSAGSSTGS